MSDKVPSLSQGLHESLSTQASPVPDDMSERERISYDYNRQRDMSKVTFFPAKKAPGLYDLGRRLRVVVYCRVSTDGLTQATSFELQRNYYLKFVRRHSQWKLIAMYSDEGVTATSTEKRIGLLQMLEDAKAGRFDVIVTKNLSRLSRNLMDCMNIIYALRNLPNPVGIFFETENLYTLDRSADFTLQVLSLVAQEESHKKSEAMLASYFMRFSQGQYMVPDLLGYDKVGKNEIAINVEEAKTVQLTFMMYLAGYAPKVIAHTLEKLERRTHTHTTKAGIVRGGIIKWTEESVLNVLKNERRCGDVLAQKTCTENYLTHKSRKNVDTLPKFYARDQHPGIVSPEDFLLTQRLIAANRGGWSGKLPDMMIHCDGALRGFVSVVPRWRGYSAEDYNRASLRAYGVEESELARLGGSIETDRSQQIMGMTGQPAAKAQDFQYRYSVDSDDYNLYPDTPEPETKDEEGEELEVFAEHIRRRQAELADCPFDKTAYSVYDLSGCERVRAELFSLRDKICLTFDRNGVVFNTTSREKLCGDNEEIEYIAFEYNPVLQMIIVRRAEDSENALHWASENSKRIMTMKKCSCKGFASVLYDNMGWNLSYKYRMIGGIMDIDGETVLAFKLDDPIKVVPITRVRESRSANETSWLSRRQTKILLEAGFAPEDIQLPPMPEIDLGNESLNQKANNVARSRAIYYDDLTSAEGVIHVEDLGDKRFDPECIRQILQRGRAPEEGWHYLKGMAKIRKNSLTIYPAHWKNSFGDEVYSDWRHFYPAGSITGAVPYGWVQGLQLPSRETVEETIRMLMQEKTA